MGDYTVFSEKVMMKLKHVMKFDTGADGFQKMIYVLAGCALLTLLCGGIFLYMMFIKGKLYA
jgi:hypothetical protein